MKCWAVFDEHEAEYYPICDFKKKSSHITQCIPKYVGTGFADIMIPAPPSLLLRAHNLLTQRWFKHTAKQTKQISISHGKLQQTNILNKNI